MAKASNKKTTGSQKAPKPRKKSRLKETFSELKKVNWPSFRKTMRQTGMVLAVVSIFTLLILGIDTLVSFIIRTLTKI